jgi:hypothetical protein
LFNVLLRTLGLKYLKLQIIRFKGWLKSQNNQIIWQNKIPILDNDTRNTRTFYTFKINLKSKVVLAKIPGHFLVADRRPNILYARIRRNCSSLKYDLFRSNIITDSRCDCGFIREDASHFLLNCRLYIEQRTVLLIFLHHHNIRRDIRILLFGDSQKDQAKYITLLSNAGQTFIN